LFGAIALATAGGTLAGTIGAMLVLPAMVLKRRSPTKNAVRLSSAAPEPSASLS
jgi:hypothetical protein